jgi:hypothetical protein
MYLFLTEFYFSNNWFLVKPLKILRNDSQCWRKIFSKIESKSNIFSFYLKLSLKNHSKMRRNFWKSIKRKLKREKWFLMLSINENYLIFSWRGNNLVMSALLLKWFFWEYLIFQGMLSFFLSFPIGFCKLVNFIVDQILSYHFLLNLTPLYRFRPNEISSLIILEIFSKSHIFTFLFFLRGICALCMSENSSIIFSLVLELWSKSCSILIRF